MARFRLLLLRNGGQVGRRGMRGLRGSRSAGLVGAGMAPAGALKRTGVGTTAAVRSGWQGAEAGPPILDSILTWRACRCEVYTLET